MILLMSAAAAALHGSLGVVLGALPRVRVTFGLLWCMNVCMRS